MENPMLKGYEALDNIVMKGTNRAVQAYNWTTGGTKLELANDLMNIGTIGVVTSIFASIPIYLGTFLSSTYLCAAHIVQSSFKIVNDKERKALDSNMKDYTVEKMKNEIFPLGAYAHLGLSAIFASNLIYRNQSLQKEIGEMTSAVGIGCYSAAFQVMRAEHLPPRKNCVARGLEKIAELYHSSQARPAEIPNL